LALTAELCSPITTIIIIIINIKTVCQRLDTEIDMKAIYAAKELLQIHCLCSVRQLIWIKVWLKKV